MVIKPVPWAFSEDHHLSPHTLTCNQMHLATGELSRSLSLGGMCVCVYWNVSGVCVYFRHQNSIRHRGLLIYNGYVHCHIHCNVLFHPSDFSCIYFHRCSVHHCIPGIHIRFTVYICAYIRAYICVCVGVCVHCFCTPQSFRYLNFMCIVHLYMFTLRKCWWEDCMQVTDRRRWATSVDVRAWPIHYLSTQICQEDGLTLQSNHPAE